MFYSHTILARKSSLGTVWIAAHLERKIKKPQIDGIDIPTYAESIMFPEVPIALRLSGHLLLGLVRIYSWKVNYLFQDCNRMVTTIGTTFAAVEIDLPVDVEPAPFDSLTLPPTLNLDDLNLDDVISQINTPDNNQKTLDQITLADTGGYVAVDLDEDDRVEPPAHGLLPYMGPEPFVAGIFPRFDDGCGANNTVNDEMLLDPPPVNSPENPNIENPSDGAQDPPEIMREAPRDGPDHFTDPVFGNDDPMVVDQDSSPFVQDKVITPPSVDGTSSAGQQLAGIHVPLQTPNTYGLIDDVRTLNSDNQLPELCLEPSPPPPQARDNKRKREMIFDYQIKLDNEYMKQQTDGPADNLLCKRRKLPQTDLDMWKFSRTRRKGSSFFLEPLVQGMCTCLHVSYNRNFPCVSDPDAEPASSEPMADYGGSQDAPSERQLTLKSHGNEDTLPEGDLTQKSPGNSDAQPEQRPTPKSPGGAGAARDEDMLPEFPRFSPVDMQSPIREDDSPFKTVSRTPHSGLGGTGVTEMPESVRTYSLPGQSTPHSDHMTSLFPVNDDYDDHTEIPGLISTPGGISSAGTGTTALGSMSARTRAVALFFKDHVPSTSSDEQPGKFSLSRILEGKVRKQAARMFFETMVLKSFDYIDVKQEEPYGDIEISVRPSLAEAKI